MKSNSFFQIEYIIILILIIINFYKIKEKFSLEKINDKIDDEADEKTIFSLRNKVSSLENKYDKLKVNQTNKNDLLKIIGPPSTISDFDSNRWIYVERLKSNQSLLKLGTQKIIKKHQVTSHHCVCTSETRDAEGIEDA